MSFTPYTSDEIWEGADFGFTLGQITGGDGVFVKIIDVTAITLNIYDLSRSNSTTVLQTIGITDIANTIYDTPQTGGGWTLDAEGYNFKHYLTVDAVGLTNIEGGHTYRLEYVVTTDAFVVGGTGNWGALKAVRDVKVRSLIAT